MQFGWAIEYFMVKHYSVTYHWDVSVRVFLSEINTLINTLSKADCPPHCGRASSIHSEPGQKKGLGEKEFCLSAWLSLTWDTGFPACSCRLILELCHQLSCVSACDSLCRSWHYSASIPSEPFPSHNTYIYNYLLLILFLRGALTNTVS